MRVSPRAVETFATHIWAWFARWKRTLPWRDLAIREDDARAYRILVSEVMLQQTQVPRVEILFKKFIREFPSLEDLARASNAQVIRAWRGMGYNSRALRLRDAVRRIVHDHGGVFPRDEATLRAIPGIGPYTAAAILNFAFKIPSPCIDTNIRRILHRAFVGPERADGAWEIADRELLVLAERLLPSPDVALASPRSPILRDTASWHAALMDFGSLVCTKRSPRCSSCPLRRMCRSAGKVPAMKMGMRRLKIEQEPGRMIAGRFTPNRIIRGRVVEFLRDEPEGVAMNDIGAQVCIDWDPAEHRAWLAGLLEKLERDGIVRRRGNVFNLAD